MSQKQDSQSDSSSWSHDSNVGSRDFSAQLNSCPELSLDRHWTSREFTKNSLRDLRSSPKRASKKVATSEKNTMVASKSYSGEQSLYKCTHPICLQRQMQKMNNNKSKWESKPGDLLYRFSCTIRWLASLHSQDC